MRIRILAGQALAGSTLTAVDEGGGLACPAWDAARLLADLELRLGLPNQPVARVVRVQRYSSRIASVADGEAFYHRSYLRDPVGTAARLLAWRDELVLAGWDGQRIEGGGARLDALAAIDRAPGLPLPPGTSDRLRQVELEIDRSAPGAYEVITLTDPPPLWPLRWRRVLSALESAGTQIELARRPQPAANPATDLGRLQNLLAGRPPDVGEAGGPVLAGDDSLLLIRADTATEAALAVAALLDLWGKGDAVVVRGGARGILDAALSAHGQARIGESELSRWRPALEVLPLAVELLFEPKDPYRVLDLLTLPVGPLEPITRRALARAMSECPGVGGRAWRAAVAKLRERILSAALQEADATEEDAIRRADRQLDRVRTWLEEPGHDPAEGAPREALAEAARRVAEWLRGRLARSPDDPVLRAAHQQAQDFTAAVASEPRARLDLIGARQLLAEAIAPSALATSLAGAGRVAAVDHPGALLCQRGTVIWWHFAADLAARPAASPWRQREREALAAAGVELADPAAALAHQAEAWRSPLLQASQRAVLVMPGALESARLEPHPLWADIRALTRAGGEELARITVHARDLLLGRTRGLPSPAIELMPPRDLPSPRPAWRLPPGLVTPRSAHSASSLELLVGCPLRFVLSHSGGLRAGRLAAVPPTFVLAGMLGHRLVEELHGEGAFGGRAADLAGRAGRVLDELLPAEAAPLLLPGASFERHQIREQLIAAVIAFDGVLSEQGLRILAVEETTEIEWRERMLTGRIDVLAVGAGGEEVVIDLKWGRSRYGKLIEQGRAVQLATYSYLRQVHTGSAGPVAAGYFSLSRGEWIATGDLGAASGAAAETWRAVERTALAVEAELAAGRVPVTGVAQAVPLGQSLGRGDLLEAPAGASCEYCRHDPLCGRRWEARR